MGDGAIRRVPKAGGTPTTIATGEAEPLGIAVDAVGIYWTNHGDGRIRIDPAALARAIGHADRRLRV